LLIDASQVVEQLLASRRWQHLARFRFEDESLLYKEVSAEVPDLFALIPDIENCFLFHSKPSSNELSAKRLHIDRFEIATTESGLHPKEAPDHDAREVFIEKPV
jgi:hypothetical protein